MHLPIASLAAVLFTASASLAIPEAGPDWPHVRGPNHNGQITSSVFEARDFALEVAWKLPMGSGYSGIAVDDGIAVTMYSDGTTDHVITLDLDSGQTLWRYPLGPTYRGHDGSDDGPVSSPIIHEGVIYTLGPRGTLMALNKASGQRLWSRNLVDAFKSKQPEYGFATTPVIDGDILIVQSGGPDGHGMTGLDRTNGDVRWSLGDEEVSYQSPTLMTLAGRRQLVAIRDGKITGHNPQTGHGLWSYQLGERDSVGSGMPTPIDENSFIVVARSGLLQLSVKETDGAYEITETLRARDIRNSYAAPVRFGDHFYGFSGAFLTCVDANTGRRVWKSRPPGGQGLILVNDHLVIFGARGQIVVAAASPEGYQEKASLSVFEDSGYTWPSFADGKILVRNPTEIAALNVVKRSEQASTSDAADMTDTVFARFLSSLETAPDRSAAIDEFMASQTSFPIVEGEWIHFVYRDDVDDVAILPSMIDRSWPDAMTRVAGTNLFHRSYRVEPASRVEYRFQVNLEEWVIDPLNSRTAPGLRSDQLVSEIALAGYEYPQHITEPFQPRGRLEAFTFSSAGSDRQREFQVYLPPQYDQQTDTAYPLLLVQEGPDWIDKGKMVHTLDNLIGLRISPVVVVFMDTIGQWWREAGGSDTEQFVNSLADEVIPQLSDRYRLLQEPRHRGIIGARDYALTALYATFKHPDVFGKAAVQSAGLQNGAQEDLFSMMRQTPDTPVKLYVDWNLYEQRERDRGWDYDADTKRLVGILRQNSIPFAGGEAIDSYGWSSWRSRSDRILMEFFPLR